MAAPAPVIMAVIAMAVLCGVATAASADQPPTFQRRYAAKTGTFHANLIAATHLRNDFYNSYGIGVSAGYYPVERWGVELQFIGLRTRLNDAARNIKEQTGLTPDARPQQLMATAGARMSLGYGKVLLPGDFLVHFDPQVVVQSGIAVADRRIVPTVLLAPSLLLHLKWGLQVCIDLNMSYQLEPRDRGRVSSFGFFPNVGIGWRFDGTRPW
ncbi:MAG: hypothetical protein MJE77_01915 [Proteobacteria bacterium]|nr:hypothetical protein [Pseudomonadota bacterium]